MKRTPKATVSQHSYIATGILTAIIQHTGTITDADIKMAVETAQKTLTAIIEVVGEADVEQHVQKRTAKEHVTDIFSEYPWTEDMEARYSELTNWLRKEKKITSGRAIDKTMHQALDAGYLLKGTERGQYFRPDVSPTTP